MKLQAPVGFHHSYNIQASISDQLPGIAIQSLISSAQSHWELPLSNILPNLNLNPDKGCKDKSREDTQPLRWHGMHALLASQSCKEYVRPSVGVGLLLRLHCHHFSSNLHVADLPCIKSLERMTYQGHTYIRVVSGFSVDLRTNTNKTSCVRKQMGIHAQNLLTIRGSIEVERTYMSIWEEYLHFDNE